VPARFKNCKAVRAAFGLMPARHQSGESDRTGGMSRCGDENDSKMLYEAAQNMLARPSSWMGRSGN
jgi:transposase